MTCGADAESLADLGEIGGLAVGVVKSGSGEREISAGEGPSLYGAPGPPV